MSTELSLFVGVLMILGNAFFVGAEFGLVSARRSKIEPLAVEGSRAAKITLAGMEQVSLMLAGAQLGITICSLILGYVSEPAIAHLLEPVFVLLSVPEVLVHPIAFAIAMTITVILHVVIGEMVPKNLALASPTRTALILAPPLYYAVKLTRPFVVSLNWVADHLLRMVGVTPKREVASSFSRDEVAGFIRESSKEGLLSDDREQLLTGVLGFDDLTARKAFLPIKNVATVPVGATPAVIEAKSIETTYSRFPLVAADGELVGYVHLKDIVGVSKKDYTAPLAKRNIRPLKKLPLTISLRAALVEMKQTNSHIVQIVDKSGSAVGIMSLEDILDEIIGED